MSDDEVFSRIKRLEDDVRTLFMRLPDGIPAAAMPGNAEELKDHFKKAYPAAAEYVKEYCKTPEGRTGFNSPEHQGKARDMVNESVGTMTGPPIQFVYTDHKGSTAPRTVIPLEVAYGYYRRSKGKDDTYWYLVAWDMDQKAERHFLLSNMSHIRETTEDREEGRTGCVPRRHS